MYIRDVAASVGLTGGAIRFYEQVGLIEKPQRTSGGYRVYSAETLKRVQFIKDAQRPGFSLEEIRETIRLKYSGQSPCDCVRKMLDGKLRDQMRRQITGCLRDSRKRGRLSHAASVICPIVQSRSFDCAGGPTMNNRTWKQGLLALPGIGASMLPKVTCPLCWPAYAGLLSSVGLGFLLFSTYLLPLTASFLVIAVASLGYRARQRRGYGPLAVGLAASGVVLTTKFALEFDTGMYVFGPCFTLEHLAA